MFNALLLSLAATTAAPPPVPAPPPIVVVTPAAAQSSPATSEAKKAAQEAAQASMFMEMFVKAFDRVIPPSPEPDAALLALSRQTMNGFLPAGAYARMTDAMVDKMFLSTYERVMGMTGEELSAAVGLPMSSGDEAKLTFRQQMTKDDPQFDARIHAYADAFRTEMRLMMNKMEPKVREGMARAMARKFNGKQLGDLNAFFATDTGRAFGQEWMITMFDGDVYRGMLQTMPDMMRDMPGMISRFEDVDKKYPWPKKAEAKAAAKPAKPAPKKK